MPAVCASASDTVSAGVDAATAKAAIVPKREKTLRREIASDLMISLMVNTPRWLVNAHADAIPTACIDLDQGAKGIETCPCRKGHEGTDIGPFRASIVSVWSWPDG